MSVTTNQITGGAFQDILGNPLANGYLVFELSDDSTVNTTTKVCSGSYIQVPLDANGNVVTSPTYSFWPNDLLTPSGTYYNVTAYNSSGFPQWGPNPQQILSTPSPFNINAWVPGDISN